MAGLDLPEAGLGLPRAGWGLPEAGGGGTDGRTYVRMYVRTDVQIPPVFYRTSSPLGPLPKKPKKTAILQLIRLSSFVFRKTSDEILFLFMKNVYQTLASL